MGRARALLALLVTALACGGSAAASSGWTEVAIEASDSTSLACAYILPEGTPPSGGWPGVILFHGLGQSHLNMAQAGSALAQNGFAALACDARGTGASGGKFGLDGPRDVEDAQNLFDWFAARSDVSDTQIGALGLSLGGGEVWNSTAAGVPFKAIVPAVTWTNLGAALNPKGVPKAALLAALFRQVPDADWDPAIVTARNDLVAGKVTAAVRSVEKARSTRAKLHSMTVPTLLLQGRHDFLFDMDQAIAAWSLLAGPKRLYLGDLGHAPATNPPAEVSTYFAEALGWFRYYLAGGPPIPGGVVLGHDPWDGTTSYEDLPESRRESVNLPGVTKLAGAALATRLVPLPGGPHETFGDGFVRVRYRGASHWPQLVATVSVSGSKTPIALGVAPIRSSFGAVKIPLMDEAVLVPRGKKLVVKVGAVSAEDVFQIGSPIWAKAAPRGASITVERATLNLSLLRRTVSK